MSNLRNFIASCKKKKKLFLCAFASLLLVSAIVSIVAGVVSTSRNNNDLQKPHHAILKSSCSATLYPELCFSAVSDFPDAASLIKTSRDIIHVTLNTTITSVQRHYAIIKKIRNSKGAFTKRQITAFHDCVEMVDETLYELHKTLEGVKDYPSLKKTIAEHADELKTFLSGAMTNQQSCLDGFSHTKGEKKIRNLFIESQLHVYKLCSNALALIKNMTDTDMAYQPQYSTNPRKTLEQEENEREEWPKWLSAEDRNLLLASSVTANVVVAADGSGNYKTVSEAVAAAPEGSSRYIIRIKAGVYRENVEIPNKKTNIMFVGDGQSTTIITASRNVVDGSTTFDSATVAAVGEGFLARDITFQNAAGPSKHQAVALRVGSDKSAFYRCGMIAYQDTLYVHSLRQFFTYCYIAGTVDFIFGNAAVVLQNCNIHARKPNPNQKNMVTAQGRTDPNQNTGIVIQKCSIGGTQDLLPVISSFPSYLGRPWKEYSRTVVMQTEISNVIDPAGWFPWDGDFALDTLTYREYQNTGAGANTANRVTWKGFKVITSASEAESYTARNFIVGSSWLSGTGFPYSLDL